MYHINQTVPEDWFLHFNVSFDMAVFRTIPKYYYLTFYFDSHLECTMEIETNLYRISLDLDNHRIFKTRRETLENIKFSSSWYWWGNLSLKNQSDFAQSHIPSEWAVFRTELLFLSSQFSTFCWVSDICTLHIIVT